MPLRTVNYERLFYFFMPGCHTCAAVKPVVEEFRNARPDVKVLPADITSIAWNAEKWVPRVTPTLVRLTPGPRARYIVFDGRPNPTGAGQLVTPEEVRLWLQQNFSWK